LAHDLRTRNVTGGLPEPVRATVMVRPGEYDARRFALAARGDPRR